jgi:3-deoxy-D-manno-octulosonic-acid transferase
LERVETVKTHLPDAVQRSKGKHGATLILDTFGELGRAYAVADVAFIGGSLAPWGGQSVFQPLAQGVPALFGPNMNNQRDIAALAIAEGVAEQVRDAEALAEAVCRWLALPTDEKATLGRRARALIERNQGVSVRCLEAVEALLAA